MSLVYWAVHETSGCGRFWKRDKLSGYDVKGRETVMLKGRGFGISPGLQVQFLLAVCVLGGHISSLNLSFLI